MLEWINKQGVKSEDGWIFQRVHRFYYYYSEGEYNLEIGVESGLVFLSKELKWSSLHRNELISNTKREEIKSRIKEALKFMGTNYKVIEQ